MNYVCLHYSAGQDSDTLLVDSYAYTHIKLHILVSKTENTLGMNKVCTLGRGPKALDIELANFIYCHSNSVKFTI